MVTVVVSRSQTTDCRVFSQDRTLTKRKTKALKVRLHECSNNNLFEKLRKEKSYKSKSATNFISQYSACITTGQGINQIMMVERLSKDLKVERPG